MTERYVHIRYRDSANEWRVGSGYIVRESTVLTANHVAEGTDHEISVDDRPVRFRVDTTKTVLSGTNDVDLGVLEIAGNPLQLGQLSFARVGRGAMTIEYCWMVGFPHWTAEVAGRYETNQVRGFINTADRIRMRRTGGAETQLLRLTIQWRSGQLGPPPLGQRLDEDAESPWGGMSGAAVCTPDGALIGVVHSHNYITDPEVLTVTPLLALKLLSDRELGRFCDALGIPDINALQDIAGASRPEAVNGAVSARSGQGTAPTGSVAAFSPWVRKAYEAELASVGLSAPAPWDYDAINQMYQECDRQYHACLLSATSPDTCAELGRVRETLEALLDAVKTLQKLGDAGLRRIGITKLQHLYYRHVGSPPTYEDGQEITDVEEMLISAASVAVRERRSNRNGRSQSGNRKVTALAAFALGIARHWQARQLVYQISFDLEEFKDWVSENLNIQSDDITKHLNDIEKLTWVIIDFHADESEALATRQWPTEIVVWRIPEDEKPLPPEPIPCTAESEESLKAALHNIVNTLVPEGEAIVDLCMPRYWLDAGVEDWNLIQIDGSDKTISEMYEPHLRWRMHGTNPELIRKLRKRFDGVQWEAAPREISRNITSDPARFNRWLRAHDGPRENPPYFVGNSHGTAGHDPLRELLRAGHGFIAWFSGNTTDRIMRKAVNAAANLSDYERKHYMPKIIRETLAAENIRDEDQPVLIWSNPEDRQGFIWPGLQLDTLQEAGQ